MAAVVLVPLAPGCEELEAVTIIDLLRRAEIEVVTAGLDGDPVRASRGVVLVPDTDLDTALQRDYDMVVLPGGATGADNLSGDPRVGELLKKMANSGRFTAAICAAPKVLAGHGLLDGKQATCYPGHIHADNPQHIRLSDQPVVIDGQVITSRGPGTAMDFALTLIETLVGKTRRDEVETALARS
ncbi:4-methyl-5(b-hydroxyethyl)-thiazole monophosphate biosynthesis [Methylohalomonas lacus]|uniref:4-methyl-5(B-hydroxyethyl)-thiazole monophosphate biosynthesis n=1 Tax=Methylohalomonas lacus TaxID=398773 RepID=A0AAE3HKE2_9GAMM|nr:DJ-1 family glyoxalase III [Methylohalomonas lacus]MCS3903936.1 4-methyl-5(b-hydroxyethyl)-thiazole monophosphate biosynthesis [Methylohalomonas lacus]